MDKESNHMNTDFIYPIIDTFPEMVCIANTGGLILFANSRFKIKTGYTDNNILDMNISDIIPSDLEDMSLNRANNNDEFVDSYIIDKNGNKIDVLVNYISSKDGEVATWIFVDAQFEKKKNECLTKGLDLAVWEWDVLEDKTKFNENWSHILGYEHKELENISIEEWMDYIHLDDLKAFKINMQKLFNGKEEFERVKYRIKHKSGNWLNISGCIKTVKVTSEGKPWEIFSVNKNVTEDINTKELLLDKKNLLSSLMKSIQEGILIVGNDYKIKYANKKIKELKDNIIEGNICYKVIMGKDKPCENCPVMKSIESNKKEQCELVIDCKGEEKYLEVFSYPVYEKNKKNSESAVEFIRDITKKRSLEKEIEKEQKINETFISQMQLGMAILEPIIGAGNQITDVKFIKVNKKFKEITKLSSTQIIGKTLKDLYYENSEEWINIIVNILETRRTYKSEKYISIFDKWLRIFVNFLDQNSISLSILDITKQKKIELDLRQSEGNYRFLVENSNDIIFELSPEGIINYVSPSCQSLLLYKTKDVIGKSINDFMHPDDIEKCIEFTKNLRSNKGNEYVEYRIKNKEGKWRWHLASLSVKKNSKGKTYAYIGTTRDITEKKKVEDELLEKSNYLRTILETTQDWFFVIDRNQKVIDINQTYCQMSGYKRNELIGMALSDLDAISNSDDIEAMMESIIKGKVDKFETKHKKKNGQIYDVEITVSTIDLDGIKFVCFGRDITQRKENERILKQRNSRVNAIIENSPLPIMIFDEEGRYIQISPAAKHIFDRPIKEIVGKKFKDILSKKNANDFMATIRRLKENKSMIEKRDAIKINDEIKIFESRLFPINEQIDGKKMYCAIVNDITNLIEMQNNIVDEKEQFRTTLLSVGDGIISTDKTGKIIVMNPVAEEITGYSQKEVKGNNIDKIFKIYHEKTLKPIKSLVRRVIKDKETIEMAENSILLDRNGNKIPVEDSAAPIKDSNGNIKGVVIVFRDVSEKRRKQNQIEYLSFHDQLTGLYNRRYMEDSLKRLDTKRNFPLAYINIDVNGLKLVNDAFGHKKGDSLLKEVAKILNKVCSEDDIPGRMGGDEFSVIMPNSKETKVLNIVKNIKELTYKANLDPVIVSLAIGYYIKENKEESIDSVVTKADEKMYRDKLKNGRSMRLKTINKIKRILYKKHDYVKKHHEDVSKYASKIGKAMRLEKASLENLIEASKNHDIGLITVPDKILSKKSVNDVEYDAIKRHAESGYQILKAVDKYVPFTEIVLYHHERWDGSGYPEGLKGEEIPIEARILQVADAFEAMTVKRVYKKGTFTKKEAAMELKRCAKTQFDPNVVDIFINKVINID